MWEAPGRMKHRGLVHLIWVIGQLRLGLLWEEGGLLLLLLLW